MQSITAVGEKYLSTESWIKNPKIDTGKYTKDDAIDLFSDADVMIEVI